MYACLMSAEQRDAAVDEILEKYGHGPGSLAYYEGIRGLMREAFARGWVLRDIEALDQDQDDWCCDW